LRLNQTSRNKGAERNPSNNSSHPGSDTIAGKEKMERWITNSRSKSTLANAKRSRSLVSPKMPKVKTLRLPTSQSNIEDKIATEYE